MMQMLHAGGIPAVTDSIRTADHDNERGYYELEAVKRTKDNAAWLREAPGKAVKVIYMLLYDLPADYTYRVIFMNRNLDEVLASQRAMLERRRSKGANVSQDQMRRIFSNQLEKVHEWLDKQPNFTVLSIDYHDIVRNPEDQSRRINEFLDGRLNVAKMAEVVCPSLYRQQIDVP
jgi:hypothetical protein